MKSTWHAEFLSPHFNSPGTGLLRLLPALLILFLILPTDLAAQTDDFGDAPDPTYPTLIASGGAQHTIVPGMFLGLQIDAEPDGQPHPNALGDDLAGLPDEDGVGFPTPLIRGQMATVLVVASTNGLLNAWIDFAANGTWADLGDQIFKDQPLIPGTNSLTFMVPAGAAVGPTFARFRFSTVQGLGYGGPAPDGEVEDYQVFIEEEEMIFDYGDAMDQPYPTLRVNNGARHVIAPGIFMGALIDGEFDGQPTLLADGDDLANLPDEDGVQFVTALIPGQVATVNVTVSVGGKLNAWIDFGVDGSWAQPGDQIFLNQPVAPGLNSLNFNVPASAVVGAQTYARFRYDTVGNLSYTGVAIDGEVEDYLVQIQQGGQQLDLGDAPDQPYPTLLVNNGASHLIVAGVNLGQLIDAEPDGQPNANATGDDTNNVADEDGVVFTTPLAPGGVATVQVVASINGLLNAWIDFGADGSWAQAIDNVFTNQPLSAGTNLLNFPVPAAAVVGTTFARFRFDTGGNLSYVGQAPDGEVEDYQVTIQEPQALDFGDAPDQPYPTLLVNNGARHVLVANVFLGKLIDAEPDGQPNASATGDDIANLADEDGVVFTSPLTPGGVATVQVVASINGLLNAWIDFGADGSWAQAIDNVFTNQPLSAGTNLLNFNVPAAAVAGTTFARFRFDTGGNLSYVGLALDGEVEDYQVTIQGVQTLDFGDAPDQPYPTFLASNGARHLIVPGMFLGALIDGEPNGQPNATATGDDLAGLADEDGVQFTGWLIPGLNGTVMVTASLPGMLDAWIDFNADGSWAQPGDQIFFSQPLAAGPNLLSFPVPPSASPGISTFARFRYSNAGGLSYTGPANDGEVEDYQVVIEQYPQHDLGDAPDSLKNHSGLMMSAYPAAGVQAFFPTVFTPLGTPPYGPIHMQPKAIAYLGAGVSLEWEADIMADEDMINNILPAPDQSDLDAMDDGVIFPLTLPHCMPATFQYVVNAITPTNQPFYVNVWFDWNRDGDWNDAINCPNGQVAQEWAVQNQLVNVIGPGQFTNTTPSFVPWHPPGKQPVWMRITLSEQTWPSGGAILGGEGPSGGYSFGETEDYYVNNYNSGDTFDWGDAPDPTYPTLNASSGANHLIVPGFLLGVQEDAETNGLPDATATGDDTNNVADEDGILFTTPVLVGTQACVQVQLLSGPLGGLLDAWLDFNRDGTWGAGEQIFSSQPLVPGTTSLCFSVPVSATLGPSFARFRLSSTGGLTPTGPAPDGEVEDYLVNILQRRPLTNIVITNIVVTNIITGGTTGQVASVWWNSEINVHYQLQSAPALTGGPAWTNSGSIVIGPANQQVETNLPSPAYRFYRVCAPYVWP